MTNSRTISTRWAGFTTPSQLFYVRPAHGLRKWERAWGRKQEKRESVTWFRPPDSISSAVPRRHHSISFMKLDHSSRQKSAMGRNGERDTERSLLSGPTIDEVIWSALFSAKEKRMQQELTTQLRSQLRGVVIGPSDPGY